MAETIKLDDHFNVEVESESGIAQRPARIRILKDNVEVVNIKGEVESQPGADGGLYAAVKFQIIKVKPTK